MGQTGKKHTVVVSKIKPYLKVLESSSLSLIWMNTMNDHCHGSLDDGGQYYGCDASAGAGLAI
jgi:hypothetical protein